MTEISPERLVTVLSDIRQALHHRSDAPAPDLVPSSSEEEICVTLGTDDEQLSQGSDDELQPAGEVQQLPEGGLRAEASTKNGAAIQRGVAAEGTSLTSTSTTGAGTQGRGRVIAVSSLGKLGRFGNQIFQYMTQRSLNLCFFSFFSPLLLRSLLEKNNK